MKKENLFVILTGVVIGIAALVLTALGNPANMGFCIACFERDIAGAVGLHSAAKVQYVRPEIIGLVLGSFLMALASKEWKARAGSSPALRFVLGAFVMIGALAFLGCPLRMVLRLAGGDLNAVVGLAGFASGIFLGTLFIRKGFFFPLCNLIHKYRAGQKQRQHTGRDGNQLHRLDSMPVSTSMGCGGSGRAVGTATVSPFYGRCRADGCSCAGLQCIRGPA